jgi:transcriptional regulator with XRE-family HTH domain
LDWPDLLIIYFIFSMKTQSHIPQEIADRVRLYRLRAGLTQADLARRIGRKKQQVHRLETGKHDIQFSTLCKVAAGLGIKVSTLLKEK